MNPRSIVTDMASDGEEQLEKSSPHDSNPTPNMSPLESERDDEELKNLDHTLSKLALSEQEALTQARAHPEETPPIYLCFGPEDNDNPRNWPKWRKWYISCFASWLNVVTYVQLAWASWKVPADLH